MTIASTRRASRGARLALALVAGLSLAAPATHAAPPPAPAKRGATMSFDQLRACAQEAAYLQQETGRTTARGKSLQGRKAALVAELVAIAAERPVVSESDHRMVQHHLTMDGFNRDTEAHSAAIKALGERFSKHQAACGGRMFLEADLARLPPDDQRAVRNLAAKAPAAPRLTPEEVRACAERAAAAAKDAARFAAIDAALEQRKAAVEADSRALEAAMAEVDTRKKKEVEAHNARARAHKAVIQAFNLEVAERNTSMAASNAEDLSYDAACSGRVYREADLVALPPELQSAMRSRLVSGRGVD